LPAESALNTGTQERVGLLGVLTEANRIKGGISSIQRQLEHPTPEIKMEKGKRKNHTNRNQDHTPSSEPSTPTSISPGHTDTPEKLDLDLKAYIMMRVKDIKKDITNSLKEIQEKTV
jgi:hypothetical protein